MAKLSARTCGVGRVLARAMAGVSSALGVCKDAGADSHCARDRSDRAPLENSWTSPSFASSDKLGRYTEHGIPKIPLLCQSYYASCRHQCLPRRPFLRLFAIKESKLRAAKMHQPFRERRRTKQAKSPFEWIRALE
jgi:hypothetical protein